jgi:hypothetical protein
MRVLIWDFEASSLPPGPFGFNVAGTDQLYDRAAEPVMRIDPVIVIEAVAFQLGKRYEQFCWPMEQE